MDWVSTSPFTPASSIASWAAASGSLLPTIRPPLGITQRRLLRDELGGAHQREQTRGLVPPGLGDVLLDLERGAAQPGLAVVEPADLGLGGEDLAVQMTRVPADENIADVEDDGVDHVH